MICDTCKQPIGETAPYSWERDKQGNVVRTTCMECREEEDLQEYERTGYLTSRVQVAAVLEEFRIKEGKPRLGHKATIFRILESNRRLQKKVKEFEQKVWYSGLQDFIRKEKVKGHSAECEGVKFLSYAMCGRWRMTIEKRSLLKGGWYIDVITAEDEPPPYAGMGINGIGATEEQAIGLLGAAISAWQSGQMKFTPDSEVRILGT